jgi:UDP-glucose-4-epimerase GalE
MHFAGYINVGESVENPYKYFQNNVEATLSLLNTAAEVGVTKFVFSSSCAVYGVPAKMPITEDMPRQPVNPYGISKLFVEQALESYQQAYGMRFASLRYFNAAGADDSGEIGELHEPESHVIPLALSAAAGTGPPLHVFGSDYATPDGTCIRDYVHVNDLAEAHVLALQHLDEDGATSVPLNLGTGRGHSVKEVMATIEEVTGQKVPWQMAPPRAGDPPVLVADATLAEKVLGWKSRRSLAEIVSSAWNWLQRSSAALPTAARASTPR